MQSKSYALAIAVTISWGCSRNKSHSGVFAVASSHKFKQFKAVTFRKIIAVALIAAVVVVAPLKGSIYRFQLFFRYCSYALLTTCQHRDHFDLFNIHCNIPL